MALVLAAAPHLSRAATGAARPLVTEVRHWSVPEFTRIVIFVEADFTFRFARLSNPDRVYFDLQDTKLSPALKGKIFTIGDERVKQVRVAQTQIGVTRVVVDLGADVAHTATLLSSPPRLAIELRPREAKAVAEAPPLPPPKPAQPDSRGQRNLIRVLGLKIGRVVLDPGHGGHDTGTIGPSGLMEKELTLDLATRLGELIADRLGGEVIFTRSDDSFVALEDRTSVANEKQADLFLSIHANSSRLRNARGIETYYLNLTADREALEVAARENAASRKSVHELQDLVSKITLTEKITESREFATQMQKSLHGALSRDTAGLRNRGVRKAPFVVLIGARMPSVLAEVSFLSNSRDEKLLKTSGYRQKVAEALFAGLLAYTQSLSQIEVAAK